MNEMTVIYWCILWLGKTQKHNTLCDKELSMNAFVMNQKFCPIFARVLCFYLTKKFIRQTFFWQNFRHPAKFSSVLCEDWDEYIDCKNNKNSQELLNSQSSFQPFTTFERSLWINSTCSSLPIMLLKKALEHVWGINNQLTLQSFLFK